MNRNRLIPSLARLLAAAVVASTLAGSQPVQGAAKRNASQLEFAIQMAKRGLWNEALFRFSRVLKERPGDAKILNNVAVAYEAIGEFDKALEHYKLALEKDSSNRELKRNYAQFVEFYEELRPKPDESASSEGEAAEAEAGEEEPAESPGDG